MMLMPLLRTRDATASSRSTNGDSSASGSGDDDEEDDAAATTDDTEEEDCIVPVGLAGSPFLSNNSSRQQQLERALLQARCYAACADQFHTTNDVSHVSAWGHS